MISTERKFIYIHVPKTGGNSIQSALTPFSDDKKVTRGHQDGIDRFDIAGPITPSKHASLTSYRELLGDISRYFVFHSARHPFDRAISGYFSSSNWARQYAVGVWEIAAPIWDADEFLKFAARMKPIVSYISVDDTIYPSDDVIRLESINADFDRIRRTLNIPLSAQLGHFNKTADQHLLIASALGDKGLRQLVENQFAEDMAYLGY